MCISGAMTSKANEFTPPISTSSPSFRRRDPPGTGLGMDQTGRQFFLYKPGTEDSGSINFDVCLGPGPLPEAATHHPCHACCTKPCCAMLCAARPCAAKSCWAVFCWAVSWRSSVWTGRNTWSASCEEHRASQSPAAAARWWGMFVALNVVACPISWMKSS